MSSPPVPGAQGGFVGDPTLLARDNVFATVSQIDMGC